MTEVVVLSEIYTAANPNKDIYKKRCALVRHLWLTSNDHWKSLGQIKKQGGPH